MSSEERFFVDPSGNVTDQGLFARYYAGGPIAGKIFCIIVAVDMIFLYILEWFLPTSGIDLPPSLHDRQERRSAD